MLSNVEQYGKFVGSYVDYAKTLTDAPEDLHVIAGKTLLSKIVGRRAYIQFAYGKMYLNGYYMGIALPSSRKTTVYGIAENILYNDDINLGSTVLPSKCTPEQLMRKLGRNSNRLYTSDEFSIFFIDAKKNYNQGIINDLVKLYDCPRKYTIGRVGEDKDSDDGDIEITDAYLNMLVFMQPDTYVEHMDSYLFGLGFPQRFEYIFVNNNHESKPRRTESHTDTSELDDIIGMLKIIRDTIGIELKVCFSDELHLLIHTEIEKKYESLWADNVLINTFPSRLSDQVYKNSAFMAIQRECLDTNEPSILGEIDVTKDDITKVIDYMNSKVIHSLLNLVTRTVGSSGYTTYVKTYLKICDLIDKYGTKKDGIKVIDHSTLLWRGHFEADTLSKVIRQAVLENKIFEYDDEIPTTDKTTKTAKGLKTKKSTWYAIITNKV